MRAHAARFEQSTPVAVRTTSTARRRLRELVATVDIPAHTRVAVYPVELVADTQEHDDTYAVAVYRSHLGLAAQATQWGYVSEVGMAARAAGLTEQVRSARGDWLWALMAALLR